jgi:ubiquinone/menaquinone biosynthesis C-methylase UbiE
MSDYTFTHGEAEKRRLLTQHQLWSEESHALWQRAGISRGQVVLDLGCGPGHTTLDLAECVGPAGRVVAVDIDAASLEDLKARRNGHNIEIFIGDVRELTLPPASFDVVHARWLFTYLSPDDIEAVVERVAMLLKPGGCLIAQEFGNYGSATVFPAKPAIARVIAAFEQRIGSDGGSADAGVHLVRAARLAGLEIEDLGATLRIARPGTPLWTWPDEFFRLHVPRLAEPTASLNEGDVADFMAEWTALSQDPDALFFAWPALEIVARKRA